MRRILTFALLSATLTLPPAFSRDFLLVTTNWSGADQQILLIDPEFGHVRSLWNGRGNIGDAIVSPDGKRVYVTHACPPASCLSLVDTASGETVQTLEAPEFIRWILPSASGMAISADGRRLYLLETNYSEGSYDYYLRVFDTQEVRFLARRDAISSCSGAQLLPLGSHEDVLVLCQQLEAQSVANPDLVLSFQEYARGEMAGGRLYTALRDGRVLEIDPMTRQILRSVDHLPLKRLMTASGTLSPDRRWYLPIDSAQDGTAGYKQILVFDLQSMQVVSTVTPQQPFRGLALSSDGKELYAAAPQSDTIAVIDTTTYETVRTLSIGARPSIMQLARGL